MKTVSSEIKYNGDSFSDIGIENGMPLNEVIKKVNSVVLSLKTNTVDLGPDEQRIDLKSAIEKVNEKVSNIDAGQISFKRMPALPDSLSYDAIKIKSEKIISSYDISGNNLVFSFDYGPLKKYANSFIFKTRLYVNNLNVNSLLQESNLSSGALMMPLDKIPAYIDISITLSSPKGDVHLSNIQNVFSAHKRTEQIVFDVKDYTIAKQLENNLSDFMDNVFNRLNEVHTIKDIVDKFEVTDLENIPAQKGAIQMLSTLLSFSDALKTKTDSIDQISIPGQNNKVSLQNAFDIFSDIYAGFSLEFKKKDQQIETLNSEVQKLQGFYSSIVNNNSGGSLTLSGGTTGSGGGSGGCSGPGCGGSVIINTPPVNESMNTSVTPTEVFDNTINSFIQEGISFIDVYMTGCGPCSQMEMTIGLLNGSINKDSQLVKFGKINISTERQFSQNYVIGLVPTFIIFKDGAEAERFEGVNTFEFFKAKIQAYL